MVNELFQKRAKSAFKVGVWQASRQLEKPQKRKRLLKLQSRLPHVKTYATVRLSIDRGGLGLRHVS